MYHCLLLCLEYSWWMYPVFLSSVYSSWNESVFEAGGDPRSYPAWSPTNSQLAAARPRLVCLKLSAPTAHTCFLLHIFSHVSAPMHWSSRKACQEISWSIKASGFWRFSELFAYLCCFVKKFDKFREWAAIFIIICNYALSMQPS